MTNSIQSQDDPSGQQTRSPQLRLTASQVKEKWLLGDYTASGYLYDLLGAFKKEGWKITIASIDIFCQTWAISRASFYRAKAKLIHQGRLAENIKGQLDLWIVSRNSCGYIDPKTDLNVETDCLRSETENLNVETDCLRSETENLNVETTTYPKPLPSKGFKDSPTPSLLSFNSSSSLSQSHPTTPERELIDFVIRSIGNTESIRNPRAYALKILQQDKQHWEEAFSQWQQRSAVTTIPPPLSPEQKKPDERESLIGLLKFKYRAGQEISAALKQRAADLQINLNELQEAHENSQHHCRDTRTLVQATSGTDQLKSTAQLRSPDQSGNRQANQPATARP